MVGGYSGGATYDADGEVVGMTTAASSGTPDPVGYAIPISTVLAIADDLESGATDAAYAYGSPAFLGIGLGETGTVVQGVYDGTPAADAGIAAGDTITRIDGTAVSSSEQLRAAIAGPRTRRRGERHLDRQQRERPHRHRDAGHRPGRVISACASPAAAPAARSGCRRSRTPRAAGAR